MALELLAPAGDMEKLKAALTFGADAVYLGGPRLHLRAAPTDFEAEGLAAAIRYTHERGKKVYVTVNAFCRNGDADALPAYFRELRELGADAVILSDLGAVTICARETPELSIHISTQASCVNYAAARAWYELGAKRVILARELSLEEIRVLRDKTPPELELEAFVHGAMCMAYSGRCLISAFLAGRDPNRGGCAQPCRWTYSLVEEKRPGEVFPVYEDEAGTTILSSRDLKAISFLDELAAAGVSSFKIEGRMKSPYYVATVTNAYRKALDHAAPLEELEAELRCVSHRPFSRGFYYGEIGHEPPSPDGYTQEAVFTAVVLASDGEWLTLEQRNRFAVGDELEVLSPNSTGEKLTVAAIVNEEGGQQEAAPHPRQIVRVPCKLRLQEGDMLRKKIKDKR